VLTVKAEQLNLSTKVLHLGRLGQGSPTEGAGSVQLTSLYWLAPFLIENIICVFTKQATLMRRSTVLSLPLQLVFPGLTVTLSWLF